MKTIIVSTLLFATLFSVAAGEKSEANKKAALDYFRLIMVERDYDAARKYVGKYIQHDPRII